VDLFEGKPIEEIKKEITAYICALENRVAPRKLVWETQGFQHPKGVDKYCSLNLDGTGSKTRATTFAQDDAFVVSQLSPGHPGELSQN
jgi:hypothetical protein